MGAVEARIFAEEGANVVFGTFLDEEGQRVHAAIQEAGGQAEYVHLDVTQEDNWRHTMHVVRSKYGELNILVNNAGIVLRYSSSNAVEGISGDTWDQVMSVNAIGVFLGTKFTIPQTRAAGGGSIVNISSGAGIAPIPETPASYSASKGAVRIFTKATAIQYAIENIECNSVHPGLILTLMLQGVGVDGGNRVGRIPLDRVGTPEEIAYGVLYLASDEAAFYWIGTDNRRRPYGPVRFNCYHHSRLSMCRLPDRIALLPSVFSLVDRVRQV